MMNRNITVLAALVCVLAAAGCGKRGAGEAAKTTAGTKTAQTTAQEALPMPSTAPITEERTLFSFEQTLDGFEIPIWMEDKADNAGVSVSLSKSFASDGAQSLCLAADFPGRIWSSALVELEQYLDLTPYRQLAVDLYVPETTPLGLKAKFVLTVGEKWRWTEMVKSVPLSPGEWVTVRVSLEPGSMDWKRTQVDDEFRADIRKIVVRVESNKQPIFNGPIYIDNVRVGR